MPRAKKIQGRGAVEFESLVPALEEFQRTVRWAYGLTGDRALSAPKIVCVIQTRGQKKHCLGRFTVNQWETREGAPVHEVMIAAETLHRPVLDIVETAIHETVHLWDYDQGIQDTSLGGRHNKNYKGSAEMIGLNVQLHSTASAGWSATSLSDDLLERVQDELKPDVAAYMMARTVKLTEPKEPTQRAWTCGCTVIRASMGTEVDGVCGKCSKPWEVR